MLFRNILTFFMYPQQHISAEAVSITKKPMTTSKVAKMTGINWHELRDGPVRLLLEMSNPAKRDTPRAMMSAPMRALAKWV